MAEIQPNWESIYKPSANLNLQGSPALDMLKQRYAQQQAQQAANVKDFTSELAKLNYNGARDADMPELHQDFGKILNTFQQYRAENDPTKQAALNLQMRQLQNQFLYKAQQSKQENDEYHKSAEMAHNPNIDLDPSYFKDMKEWSQTPTNHPSYDSIKDRQQNWVVPKVDLDKIWNDAFIQNKSDSKESGKPVFDRMTGEYKTPTYSSTTLKHDDFVNNVIKKTQSPAVMKNIARAYPNMPIDQAVQQFAEDGWKAQQNKLGTDTTFSAPFESFAQKMQLAAYRNQLTNPNAPTPQPREEVIKFKKDGVVTGAMNLHNYRPVSIPKATVIPTKAVNDGGESVDLPAGEVRVIGYADMPVSNADTKLMKKGDMVMSHFEQHNPDMVTTKPVVHIQVDHKGHTKNYYVDPEAVNTNVTGMKAQNKVVQGVKETIKPPNQRLY